MKKIKQFIAIFLIPYSLFLIPSLVLAAPTGLQGATDRLKSVETNVYGVGAARPFEEVVGGYIQGALALLGVIFLVLLVYGGYTWMIARGEEAEVTKAKGIIQMAVIGLVIVLAAYAITAYVVVAMGEATGT